VTRRTRRSKEILNMSLRPLMLRLAVLVALLSSSAFLGGWKWDSVHF